MTSKIALTLTLLSSGLMVGASAQAQTAREGGRKLTATLTGAAEVNAQGVFNQGDPDGTGTAIITVNAGQERVCYEITVNNIADPTASHIHEAPVDESGPVKVPLTSGFSGSITGCEDVTRELALEILKDPSDYYVNVHNAEFPLGAVRGQLSK